MRTRELYVTILIVFIIGVAYYCHSHHYDETRSAMYKNLDRKHYKGAVEEQRFSVLYDDEGRKIVLNDVYRTHATKGDTKIYQTTSSYDRFKSRNENVNILKYESEETSNDYEDNIFDEDDDDDDDYEEYVDVIVPKTKDTVTDGMEEENLEVLDKYKVVTGTIKIRTDKPDTNRDQIPTRADNKNYRITTNSPKHTQCPKLKPSQKFDCHPEIGVNKATCLLRGCCWDEVEDRRKPLWTDNPDDTQAPVDVPWCYYPPGFPGYVITGTKETEVGFRAYMMKNSTGYYPGDVKYLAMDVIYETDNTVHVKITDAKNRRYEVPLDVPTTTKKASNPAYSVITSNIGSPFELTVKRRGGASDQVIFSTKDMAPLMYSDQFLQLSSALPSPYIYGIGENRDDLLLSVNWTRHTLWSRDQRPKENTNLYGVHPFYMVMEEDGSSNGFFLLNSNAMDVVIQPHPAITWRTIGGILDFYIFLGPTPKDITRQYTSIIGRPFMPPYWSLGFHLCRWGYETAEDTLEAVDSMRAAGIPLDTQWNDIDYMRERKVFITDPENFGDQAALVTKIHDYGMKYIVILDPGIAIDEPKGTYKAFDMGLEIDLFIRNDFGKPFIGKVWPGLTVFPDFTHPNVQVYWDTLISDFLDEISADGLWIDMNEIASFLSGSFKTGCPKTNYNEPPYIPAVQNGSLYAKTLCPSAMSHISREYDVHSIYGLKETNATYQALRSKLKSRPFVISRSTYAGQGHYGGHWSGDNEATYHDLYRSISETLSMNLFGVPMAGADICGFTGDTEYHLCLRWHQLGAFYPFSRNHNDIKSMPQEPFRFDDKFSKAVREVYLIRYSLLPYLYTLFYFSHIQGDTVARPMFQEFPWDKNTYAIDSQFMWGSALLIVPVLFENELMVKAYLPNRTQWFDFYTGFSYGRGPKVISMAAPIDKINLLVQGGNIIPMQEPGQTTTQSRLNTFSLLGAYCDQQRGFGVLYWDDGDSLDTYEKKAYNEIEFHMNKTTLFSKIISAGYRSKIDMLLSDITLYGVEEKPVSVYLNGNSQEFSYDSQLKVLKVMTISPKINLLQEFALWMTGLTGVSKGALPTVSKNNGLSGSNQDSLTNKLPVLDKASGTNNLPAVDQESFTNNNIPAADQNDLTNNIPAADQNRLTNLPVVNQDSLTNNNLPVADQSRLTNNLPVVDQESLTNNLPAADQESLTNNLPAADQSRLTNSPVVDQESLTNNNLPVVDQDGLTNNNLPAADQSRLTNLPVVNQDSLTNNLPVADQSRLTNLPVVDKDGLTNNNLPVADQSRLTNNLPMADQESLTNNLPVAAQESLTNNLPAVDQNRLTNLPVVNQESLTNNNLPAVNQDDLTNNLPAVNQDDLTNNLLVANQNKLTNNLQAIDRSRLTNILPAADTESLTNNLPAADQEMLSNNLPVVDKSRLNNNLPAAYQESLISNLRAANQENLANKLPVLDKSILANNVPVTDQSSLTNKFPIKENTLNNKLPMKSSTNQIPNFTQDGLSNQLPELNQGALVNKIPELKQEGLNHQIPELKQEGLINQIPELKQEGLNDQIPELKQEGLNDQIPELKQEGLNNQIPELSQGSLNNQIPELNRGGLTNQIPELKQERLTNDQIKQSIANQIQVHERNKNLNQLATAVEQHSDQETDKGHASLKDILLRNNPDILTNQFKPEMVEVVNQNTQPVDRIADTNKVQARSNPFLKSILQHREKINKDRTDNLAK